MGREEIERELKEREAKCKKRRKEYGRAEEKSRSSEGREEKTSERRRKEGRQRKGKGRKREKRCDEKRKRGKKEKGEREIKSGITTPPRSKPGAGGWGGGWRRSRRNYSVWQCRNALAFSPSVRRPCDLQLPWLLTDPRIWCRR